MCIRDSFIGFFTLRLQIIHWLYQWQSRSACTTVHSVKIRNQLMTQFQEILHYCFYDLVVFPRFLSIERVVCAVQTVHWRKNTKLYPSCSELVVSVSQHMSTDIMTPPSKTDVAGICREIWLEFQTFPGNDRITGKTNRVSVASGSCIS